MSNKELFIEPTLEVVKFNFEDIITGSIGFTFNTESNDQGSTQEFDMFG